MKSTQDLEQTIAPLASLVRELQKEEEETKSRLESEQINPREVTLELAVDGGVSSNEEASIP